MYVSIPCALSAGAQFLGSASAVDEHEALLARVQ